MNKEKVARLTGSPVLLLCLLLMGAALATASFRAATANRPPEVAGFDWSRHPSALLIAIPPDECGCGLSLTQWISTGTALGLHVVIAASKSNADLDELKKVGFPARSVSVFTNVNSGTIRQLSPKDQTTATLVHNGRVVSKLEGGAPPPAFFK